MVHRHGRLILMVLALTFVLAACAPASAQPTDTPAPTIAPTITPDAAQPLILVLPSLYDQKTLIASNRHYSDAVKRMGWNVEFYTVQSNDANGTDAYLPYVNKQICSGAARADGFVCMQSLSIGTEDPLLEAKASGQLYDCVAAAPQAIPQYWAKFQDQISAGKYGLVMANQSAPPLITDLSLAVRMDVLPLVDKGISGYDDLRALIARMEQAHVEKASVQADPMLLLSLWTKQQGYMELFSYAGIYTRVDDPEAKPVLLEDIPGFSQFYGDITALQDRGILQQASYLNPYVEPDNQSSAGDMTLGPAAALEYTYNLLYNYSVQGISWKGYAAYPMKGDGPYADDISQAVNENLNPRYVILRELIIPAHSRRATDAMAFIQWIYSDRRNADTVIYGQEGEDYSLQGERMALPMADETRDSQSMPPWQRWPGRYLFQYAAERRIMVNMPENAETLLGEIPSRPLAAPWLARMPDTTAWENLMSRDSTDSRENAMQTLLDMIQNPSGSKVDVVPYIKLLRNGTTDSALQPYLDVLAEARATPQP